MIILYISKLSGNPWAGPNYSVPAQIAAQAEVDAVFWYNLNRKRNKEWEDTGYFHNLEDIPSGRLCDIPPPFNRPDLTVIEELYSYFYEPMIKDIRRKKIPYIIVPRGCLTAQAQKRHRLKKIIGNLLFFRRFTRQAAMLQYLTEQESRDSGVSWNKKSVIIPNGIKSKDRIKSSFSRSGTHAAFIGRITLYHKGLDMLTQACAEIADELRKLQVRCFIYGPDWQGEKAALQRMIDMYQVSDLIIVKDAVYGEEKAKVLLESDVFLMTSRFEGHPMGLIEALSYGIPCFVTKGTNMLTEIKTFDAGWTVENNVASIKDGMLEMGKDRENFKRKGDNAKLLSEKYIWTEIAQLTHSIYEEKILELEKQNESK